MTAGLDEVRGSDPAKFAHGDGHVRDADGGDALAIRHAGIPRDIALRWRVKSDGADTFSRRQILAVPPVELLQQLARTRGSRP
jgi:hypothetical protein